MTVNLFLGVERHDAVLFLGSFGGGRHDDKGFQKSLASWNAKLSFGFSFCL